MGSERSPKEKKRSRARSEDSSSSDYEGKVKRHRGTEKDDERRSEKKKEKKSHKHHRSISSKKSKDDKQTKKHAEGVPKLMKCEAEGEIEIVDESEGKLGKKRKRKDWDENLICDGILSNEDFQRIKQLKRNKEGMAGHGLKIPDSEQLRMKRVDPAEFEAHIKLKLTKEQLLELVKVGREDRGKYRAKTAIKHGKDKNKGLSNRQKEQKKSMPLAAKRSKIAKSKQANQRKQSKKQFRGRKAWK